MPKPLMLANLRPLHNLTQNAKQHTGYNPRSIILLLRGEKVMFLLFPLFLVLKYLGLQR